MLNELPETEKNFLDQAFFHAEMCLHRNGSFTPLALLQAPDSLLVVPAMPFATEVDKDMFFATVQMVSIVNNVNMVAFVSESWALSSKDEVDMEAAMEITRNGGSIGDHPKAIEIIMATVQSRNGFVMSQRKITRKPNNWIEVEPDTEQPQFVDKDSDMTFQGRFTNLLPNEEQMASPILRQRAEMLLSLIGAIKEIIEPNLNEQPNRAVN